MVRELQGLIARHTASKESKEAFLKGMADATRYLSSTVSDYSPDLKLPTNADVKQIIKDLRELPDRIRLLKTQLSVQELDT